MEQQEMLELLEQVQAGKTSPKEALLQMKMQPFEDLGLSAFATVRLRNVLHLKI